MNIIDLIRENSISSTQDAAFIQRAINTLGDGVVGVADSALAANLVLTAQGSNFFAGHWGTLEDFCMQLTNLLSANQLKKDAAGHVVQDGITLGHIGMLWDMLHTKMPAYTEVLERQALQRCVCDASWGIPDNVQNSMIGVKGHPLCTFEYLNRAVGVMVTKTVTPEKTTRKLTLVTRSIEILNKLYAYKMLVFGKAHNFVDIYNKLWGVKDMEALVKDNKAYVIQLNCSRVVANPDGSRRPIFEMSYTRGRVSMSYDTAKKEKSETTTYFYPLSMLYVEELLLKKKLKDSCCRVIKETDYGDKERIVTSNRVALCKLYEMAGSPVSAIQQKAMMLWGADDGMGNRAVSSPSIVGFDIVNMHYYFPDVEGSVYEPAVFGIRPGAIKSITPVQTASISRDMYNVNPYYINQIFNTRVSRATLSDFDCLPEVLGLSALKYKREKRERVVAWGHGLNNKEMYQFVTAPAHAQLFGDVPKQIEHRMKTAARYLKNLEPVNMQAFATPEALRDFVTEKLKTGVLRMTVLSNKHEVTDLMATNMSEILERTYGKDAIEYYESPRKRLQLIATLIKATPIGDEGNKTITDFIESCGMTERLSELIANSLRAPRVVMAGAVEEQINELASRDKDIDPNTIYYRIADGYKITTSSGKIAIIRQCNVGNIIKLAYAPYEKVVSRDAK